MDENKIREIYYQHYSLVMKVAYSLLHNKDASEDVAAEVFLKLVERLRVKKDIDNIEAYLCIVTKNTAYDYLKKHKKNLVPLENVSAFLQSSDHTAAILNKLFIQSIIYDLRCKNEKWCDICLMRYLLGMSIKDISETYQCTESSVEGELYRAKKYIREKYKSSNLDPAYFLLYLPLFFTVRFM